MPTTNAEQVMMLPEYHYTGLKVVPMDNLLDRIADILSPIPGP